jgi:hypothetical protein
MRPGLPGCFNWRRLLFWPTSYQPSFLKGDNVGALHMIKLYTFMCILATEQPAEKSHALFLKAWIPGLWFHCVPNQMTPSRRYMRHAFEDYKG